MAGLRITDVRAYPTSFPVDPKDSVTLGIGRTVKRDAVIVKVSTEDGVTGWGEAHHGRCPGAVAHLVNTTLKQLVVGQDANDIIGVWKKVYDKQLASHGMGAGACLALSGIDMALWDIRGKALGCRCTSCWAGAPSRYRLTPAVYRSATRIPRPWWPRRGHMCRPATRPSSCASAIAWRATSSASPRCEKHSATKS